MYYLNPDEIIALNEVAIQETGGSLGLREPGMLEAIAQKPQAQFGGNALYPDVWLKSAALYEAIINYHVFLDGNKRTAVTALGYFLACNNFLLALTDKEIETYTVFVATNNPDLADIALWVDRHVKKKTE